MAITTKPMTEKQLAEYVATYSDVFADWSFSPNLHYFRVNGPILQQIWFENLKSGAYRPASGLRILVAPDSKMLHQFLDIKNREILPREHLSAFTRVVEAMNEQFVPAIRKPLDPVEVCILCEKSASHRINDAYTISAFYAYLGNEGKAFEWLDILDELTVIRKDDLLDWERDRLEFGIRLRESLNANGSQEFLESILSNERRRLLS